MEIIEEIEEEFQLVYEDVHGDGYAFPCDKHGSILWEKVSSPATVKKSIEYCKEHTEKWDGKNGEVVTIAYHSRYGICPGCGHKVYLNGSGYFGAFDCDCGRWYNRFGQEIKPPKYWFEDRDDDWYEDLYNDWIDDSYKYRYED